ncbi:MAG: helix-turn-helix domain-containing protein, partial [Parcubacteria group bacterium]|nr:helix-turn-helix domain-containing protein [Parcubacteria group bacterium]
MGKTKKKLNKLTYSKPKKPTVDFALVSQAARGTAYSSEYLSLLVRKGKINGRKFGRNWYVSKKSLAGYLAEHQPAVPSPIFPLSSPFIPFKPVLATMGEMGQTGEKGKPEQDLATDIKKELDELEAIYKNHETQNIEHEARNMEHKTWSMKPGTQKEENVAGYMIHDSMPKPVFPKIDQKKNVTGFRFHDSKARWAEAAVMSIVVLGFILGGFNLKFANALYGAVKEFIQDAVTLQGRVPGTHANEILLLDKEGKISIYGHIETQGQFRSYAEQGVAPIIVDSTTTAENLSADYLDGISGEDFTLQLVTKNGNVTFDTVKLEGGAEVGKLLLVKGAAQFLDYVSVAKNLSVGGDLVVNGVSTLAGKLNSLAGALFTGRVEVKGDIDATGFIAAQRGQIKEGGLVVSGHTQLNSLGVSSGLSVSDLGVAGNFSVVGKEISLGDSWNDKLNVT